jgi:glucose/arabinose dehydrogenase
MRRFCHGRPSATAAVGLLIATVLLAVVALSACGQPARGSAAQASSAPAPMPSPAVRAAAPVFRLKQIAQGLASPVYVTAPRGDTHRLFVVEKGGRVLIVKNGTLLSRPFLDLTGKVGTGTEQGLLSLAFGPHYATSGRFYVFYTDLAGNIRVVRYKVSANADVALPSSARVLWRVAHSAHANHNGGQLQFGPDGRLYIGIGDGGSERDPNLYGQNIHVPYAKIWRLNVAVSTAAPRMYAYGLRNPWRFSFDPATGNLWIGDVGQDRWEEIDFLKAGTTSGTNFGWSYYEGDHVFKLQPIVRTRLRFPVFEYSHTVGCAVTGGYVYRGGAIPTLRGYYLFADFCSGRVWMMKGPTGTVARAPVSQKVTQISSFGRDASGELYLVSLTGSIYKLVP